MPVAQQGLEPNPEHQVNNILRFSEHVFFNILTILMVLDYFHIILYTIVLNLRGTLAENERTGGMTLT
jgi:hypothetical protein